MDYVLFVLFRDFVYGESENLLWMDFVYGQFAVRIVVWFGLQTVCCMCCGVIFIYEDFAVIVVDWFLMYRVL